MTNKLQVDKQNKKTTTGEPLTGPRGKIFFVDWSDGGPGDDENDGLSPETALFSYDEALRRIKRRSAQNDR